MTLESKARYPFPLPCPSEGSLRYKRAIFGLTAMERSYLSGTQGLESRAENKASSRLHLPLYILHSCFAHIGVVPRGSPLLAQQSSKTYFGEAIPNSVRGLVSKQRRAQVQENLRLSPGELALLPPQPQCESPPSLSCQEKDLTTRRPRRPLIPFPALPPKADAWK